MNDLLPPFHEYKNEITRAMCKYKRAIACLEADSSETDEEGKKQGGLVSTAYLNLAGWSKAS